jgi:acetyl/propionyl-CoA carboxylase alpha subunit
MPKTVQLTRDSHTWTALVDRDRVTLSDIDETFVVRDAPDGRFTADGPAAVVTVTAVREGDVVWIGDAGHAIAFHVETGAARPRSASRDQDALSPPMAATVVRVGIKAGDRVRLGDTLVVLEAMKMELPIRAPREATVRAVHCVEGQLVQPGVPLVELDD